MRDRGRDDLHAIHHQADLRIRWAFGDGDNDSRELIAHTGLHRGFGARCVVAGEAIGQRIQTTDEAAMFILHQREILQQLTSAPGQFRPAAAFAACEAFDEFAARERRHLVDGIPGTLVAVARQLCRLGQVLQLLYLPKQLDAAELDAEVDAAIAAVPGAAGQGAAAMGKVMAILKPRIAGRTDMGAASALVKRRLAG